MRFIIVGFIGLAAGFVFGVCAVARSIVEGKIPRVTYTPPSAPPRPTVVRKAEVG